MRLSRSTNEVFSFEGGLVQTFDTEGGKLIKDHTPVLESMIGCLGCRAELLPTNPAMVSTSFPPSGLVEAVVNDSPGVAFSGWRAVPVCTAETLHGLWTLPMLEPMASN